MRLFANYGLLHAFCGLWASLRHPCLHRAERRFHSTQDGVTGASIHTETAPQSQVFSRRPSAHSRSEFRTESTMKLVSPSFTGVLPVALRTRVCGMVTDSEVQKFVKQRRMPVFFPHPLHSVFPSTVVRPPQLCYCSRFPKSSKSGPSETLVQEQLRCDTVPL